MSSVVEPTTDHDVPRSAADGPQLRTILLTDLVESTALVEQLGDGPAADLFREHDRLVVELQQQWRGRLIDRSDGLLLLFERAIDGLGFALDYNRGLLRDRRIAQGDVAGAHRPARRRSAELAQQRCRGAAWARSHWKSKASPSPSPRA